jgi:D-alanyl-D-alanine carboxypeptidase
MKSISRRRFVAMLASVPFVRFVPTSFSATTERSWLSHSQIEAIELILSRLVESGAVPGVSYSIGHRSETLAEGGFGLRVIEPRAPMEARTHCPLASVSKQVVSAGGYLLQQKGMLSLDEPLSKYLPDYVRANEMTLLQVLTMRSGIPADDEKCEAPVDGKIDEASLLANLNKQKLDFEPGRYFAYSNCAYNLAGVVLARVTKMSYDRFIEESFFQPLGMKSSYVLGPARRSELRAGLRPRSKGMEGRARYSSR